MERRGRILFVLLVLGLGYSLVALRLVYLQVYQRAELTARAERQQERRAEARAQAGHDLRPHGSRTRGQPRRRFGLRRSVQDARIPARPLAAVADPSGEPAGPRTEARQRQALRLAQPEGGAGARKEDQGTGPPGRRSPGRVTPVLSQESAGRFPARIHRNGQRGARGTGAGLRQVPARHEGMGAGRKGRRRPDGVSRRPRATSTSCRRPATT